MKEETPTEAYITDKPIGTEAGADKFQRKPFAKRIARTIASRQSSESITVGIYGAWGEGKSSVLNLIEEELDIINEENKDQPNILCIRFNPWRFPDEETLLRNFFFRLADETVQAEKAENEFQPIPQRESFWKRLKGRFKRNPLLKASEQLGGVLGEYAGMLSVFQLGGILESVGKSISQVEMEDIKERVRDLLAEKERTVIIFIDDIDRLDKDEIYAIFRLVKLTGNIDRVHYILAFDDKMVAAAIRERFSSESEHSGRNFIEKIIQVPLRLPSISKGELRRYCLSIIEESLKKNDIDLSEEDDQRLIEQLSENVFQFLKTPRLAVRYGNSISFSLPILKGKVNYVDLILLEFIKIYFPQTYQFIKSNPEIFVSNLYGAKAEVDKGHRKMIKDQIDTLLKGQDDKKKRALMNLLSDLFPRLDQIFHNFYHKEKDYDAWHEGKRVTSPRYFNRYFLYSVTNSEDADIEIHREIIHLLDEKKKDKDFFDGPDSSTRLKALRRIIKKRGREEVLTNLESLIDQFYQSKTRGTKSELKDFVLLIGRISETFNSNSFSFYHAFSPISRLALMIVKLLEKNFDTGERKAIVSDLIRKTTSIEFMDKVLSWINRDSLDKEMKFSEEQLQEIGALILERIKGDDPDIPFFEKHPVQTRFILNIWCEINPKELKKYIKNQINGNRTNIASLIKSLSPSVINSTGSAPFQTEFREESYQLMKSKIDVDIVYQAILQTFDNDPEKIENALLDEEGAQDELKTIKQFLDLYQKDKNPEEEGNGK